MKLPKKLMVIFKGGENMMHMWGYPNMMGWGLGGIVSFALFVLFWVMVAILIAALVRGFMHHIDKQEGSEEKEGSALNIIKVRYAKGEITKKEFEEMKKTIS